MLKKIMGIMNRKPEANGLDGVPLKKYGSIEELEDSTLQTSTFIGNADISLIQSNVDSSTM